MLVGVDLESGAVKAVNNLLNFHGVTISVLKFSWVSKGNVFETVNLTEAPEHGVSILARTLDLEHFAEIEFFECGKCKLIDHLILGEGLSRVLSKVVGDIIAGVEGLKGFEEAELAYDVLR